MTAGEIESWCDVLWESFCNDDRLTKTDWRKLVASIKSGVATTDTCVGHKPVSPNVREETKAHFDKANRIFESESEVKDG